MSSDSKELFSTILLYIYRYYIPAIYIISNIGNILSIIVFLKQSWRKNVCVFYFLVCLVSNLCYAQTSILPTIFNNAFQIYVQNSNRFICKVFYYTSYLSGRYSPSILILASIDRLLISSQNVNTRLYSSRRLAYLLVSTNTFVWLIYFFHVLVKVDLFEISPSKLVCYFGTSQAYNYFLRFSTIIINGSSSMILLVLLVLAFKNVRQIKFIPRQQQRQQIRKMSKKDFQLLRCLYAYSIVYFIFSLPSIIVNVYMAIRFDPELDSFQSVLESFFSSIYICINHTSYCFGFFIFLSISKNFRQEIKRMLYSFIGKVWTPTVEIEQQQENVAKEDVQLNTINSTVSST